MADLTIARLHLPADLTHRTVNLVAFPDEAACRAFYPGRSLELHEAHNRLVKMHVVRNRGRVAYTVVTAARHIVEKTQEERTAIAERYVYLVPIRTH